MISQRLKKILTSSIIYTLANSIEALTPFMLAMILTRKLDTGQYGIWVLFISLFTFLRPVISLSVQDALRMHYFGMDRHALAELMLSSLLLVTLIASSIAGLTYLGQEQLSVWLKFPASWLISIVATAYLHSIFYFLLAFNQFEQRKKRFIFLHLVQSFVGIGITIGLIYNGWNWHGAVIGKIAGLCLVSLLGITLLSGDLSFRLNKSLFSQVKKLTIFGLHYLPTGLSLVFIPLTDRLIISHLLGLSENGLYGVAALFGSAFFILVNGFFLAWMPWLFKKLEQSDKNHTTEIRQVSLGFILLLPILAMVFYGFCNQIVDRIIGVSFRPAVVYIPWVITAFVMQGYFLHNQAFLLHKQAVLIMSIVSTLCIILNIVLSYLWALDYGVQGVIVATIISYFICAVLSALLSIIVYKYLEKAKYSYV